MLLTIANFSFYSLDIEKKKKKNFLLFIHFLFITILVFFIVSKNMVVFTLMNSKTYRWIFFLAVLSAYLQCMVSKEGSNTLNLVCF